jgi:hypothetical protein
MNMQTIQIMILLLDGFIKLTPWRIVTEAMDRIGYAAGESLARGLGVVAAACTGRCALPTASVFEPLLLIGYFGGVVPSHIQTSSPLFSYMMFGFYLGAMVWGGIWLRDRQFPSIIAAIVPVCLREIGKRRETFHA